MIMAKVAEIIRFYSLDEIMNFIDEGGEYPLHHVWSYDYLNKNGINTEGIDFNNKSSWNKLGCKLQILNLQQQINLLRRSKEFDLIYAPFVVDVFLLAMLKMVGLYKKPIIALGLDTHIPYKNHPIKKLRQQLIRKVYKSGIDTLLFFNETMYKKNKEYGPLSKNDTFAEWGADIDFFSKYIERQTQPPSLDFIYSTGGTGRDFNTLVKAFSTIDFGLKITTKKDEQMQTEIPPNVIIDDTVKPGLNSVGLIRKEYYNSLAVAIALKKTGQIWPVGITVIMEALAMAKPIISTVNSMYPFNLEKEKIGFYVDYNDVEGWRDRVNYMINHPDEAREMGERGRYLCEKKFNYKNFSMGLYNEVRKFVPVAKKVQEKVPVSS